MSQWSMVLVMVCVAVLSPALLHAQPLPPTPGGVEDSLRPRTLPPVETSPAVEAHPPPRREAVSPGGPRIPVRHFVFEGNTVYSDDELRAVVAELEGQALTLEEVYAAADVLTDFYLKNGYSVALVTVPAQQVADGTVRFEAIEGRISQLHLEGNARYRPAVLHSHLARVERGEILRFDHLERGVLLLNDLPGLLARSVIVPGEEYGTSTIRLNVEESPWDARLALDNHGPESVGEWRTNADININSLAGIGDRLDLGVTLSENNLLRQGRIAWSRPIGSDGGRLGLSYSRAEYDVGGDFVILGISGRSENARIQYSHPHLRSRRKNLYWNLAASHSRGRSVMDGVADLLTDSTVNLLEVGLNHDVRLEHGTRNASLRLATNLRRNGTENDGTTRDGGVPLRLNLSGGGEHFFDGGWSLAGRGELQLSADSLPDTAQIGIGGPHSVRGFIASRHRGDQGLLATAEVRRYRNRDDFMLVLRGFVDAGVIKRKRPLAGQRRSDELASLGLGVSAVFNENINLDLSWAMPVVGREHGDERNRVWAILGMTF